VVGGGVGYATSIIIFGGAAQLATIDLFNAGAAGPVIVATGLIINSRHLMYSAALAPAFSAFSRPWRLGLPYLLTDQAFAVSIVRYEEQSDIGYRRLFYLGAGLALWVTWQLTTGVGVIFGTAIPATWSLDFAIPLVFVALLIPTLKDRPALIAAVVAAGAAVAAASVPYHLGLMIGALCGVVAGVVAERGASAPSHDVGDVQGEHGALPARTQDEGASSRCFEDEDAAGSVPGRPERGRRRESGHQLPCVREVVGCRAGAVCWRVWGRSSRGSCSCSSGSSPTSSIAPSTAGFPPLPASCCSRTRRLPMWPCTPRPPV
jgi:predicted branched-subunit amino acid permease